MHIIVGDFEVVLPASSFFNVFWNASAWLFLLFEYGNVAAAVNNVVPVLVLSKGTTCNLAYRTN